MHIKHDIHTVLFCIGVLAFNMVPVYGLPGSLPNFYDDEADDTLIQSLISSMTDEELLGQVFFLGYQGIEPSDEIKYWISKRQLGGVKVFSRNMDELDNLAKSINDMQVLAASGRFSIPLFIATDQEGGWVRHIWKDVLVVPGNLAIGASRYGEDAYLTGYYIGLELAALGINMNFAPDVDVYSDILNTAIGPRSFSSDPVQTGLLACGYFKGMKKAGIICTAKHFPGHGGAEEDSHGILPQVHVSYDEMWDRELVPYRFLIKEGIPAIMTGHLSFPDILKDKTPATLSSFFLEEVLRKRLHFKGIVITDDLEMYGAHQGKINIPEVTKSAIFAGNDMLLISHRPQRQESAWNPLLRLIKTDKLFRSKIIESVEHILSIKCQVFKGNDPSPIYPDYQHVKEKISKMQSSESLHAIFQSICRSITVIQNGIIPYTPAKAEKILLVGQYTEFLDQGILRFPKASVYEYSYYPAERSLKEVRTGIGNLVEEHDTIIFLLVNDNSLEILKTLRKTNKKIIVISSLTPVYLREVPWVKTAIAVYGTGKESYEAGFAVLCGDYEAEGKLPLVFE
ncbi:MAG: glycoside hydrolase family 3 protein [Spirochaetales bacterium]|nr:glycoside hydrolase family 3 protein [Spirochaetales bacterium]